MLHLSPGSPELSLCLVLLSSLPFLLRCDPSSFEPSDGPFCLGKCNEVPHEGEESAGVRCMCDRGCAVHGDCCMDYLHRDHRQRKRNVKCLYSGRVGDIYMVDTCKGSWRGPRVVKQRCSTSEFEVEDPFGGVPVTSVVTNVTYKNYNCAICNGDTNVVMWQVRVAFLNLNGHVRRNRNVTKEYLVKHLTYNASNYKWGVWMWANERYNFYGSRISIFVSRKVRERIRKCVPLVSSCLPDWTNNTVQEGCESYLDPVYEVQIGYRNAHCALCNNASMETLSCTPSNRGRVFGTRSRDGDQEDRLIRVDSRRYSSISAFPIDGKVPERQPRRRYGSSYGQRRAMHGQPVTYSVIVDFNNSISRCKSWERYDHFLKRCRNVYSGV